MPQAATQNGRALVIVESPTKAKTIRKFLGDGFIVEASMGHVRDLPTSAAELPAEVRGEAWARLGVNVEQGFQPVYVVPAEKRKVVADLRKALAGVDRLYLATDEDREGESIGWHLAEVLKPKVPTFRMVFHEITREAIQKALASPRDLDLGLVQAQEARRVLDRLVGYVISPLLWRKVAPRLSAGRVQSVAVRLLVLRERERMAFVVASWWDLSALALKDGVAFEAQLSALAEVPVASGKDFVDETGQLKAGRPVRLLDEASARALAARLKGLPLTVDEVDRKVSERTPYPPFTTSTLQQEANRKLGMTSSTTMKVAQRLYESGHITYMRTDSMNVAEEAIAAIRGMVAQRMGQNYLSPTPRRFSTTAKGAQEAHEAIRPAGTQMATADELGLSGPEAKLYELIWQRTVATQMANAQVATTTVRLSTVDPTTSERCEFKASGREILFPGFLRAYVNGSDDPNALDDREKALPRLEVGQVVPVQDYRPEGHETRPPARYTEASLVKTLEAKGIGRPSTYAAIIDTIQRRGYVRPVAKQLVPTFTAMAVTRLLEEMLSKVVDVEFTASMEDWLDRIATGDDAQAYLERFYKEDLVTSVEHGQQVDARQICTITSEHMAPYAVRLGRFGPYVELQGEGEDKPRAVSIPEDLAPADADRACLEALIGRAAQGEAPLGHHPTTNEPVYLRAGRFGPYVQLGEATDDSSRPKRQSLPPGVEPSQVTLPMALAILELPRELGPHPDSGKPVRAGLGKFGPFVTCDGVFASLKKGDNVLSIGLSYALTLIQAKVERGSKVEVLKELGVHPEDGEPLVVLAGRYGPYVKYGSVNATLPDGVEPEALTLEQALALVAGKAPKKGKGRAVKAKKAEAGEVSAPKPVRTPRAKKTEEAASKPARTPRAKKAEPSPLPAAAPPAIAPASSAPAVRTRKPAPAAPPSPAPTRPGKAPPPKRITPVTEAEPLVLTHRREP